jgi:hypothetical protein
MKRRWRGPQEEEEPVHKAIGFRTEPRTVHWATVSVGEGEGGEPVLEDHGAVTAPRDFSEGAALTWFRGRIRNLLEEQAVHAAGFKYAEPVARGAQADSARARARLEGVLLQLMDESALPVFAGAFRALSGQLKSKSAKAYIAGNDMRGLDVSALSKLRKEALLVALAALEA